MGSVPANEGSATMVKFLKNNKVVILLTGRYAGKKAVIVRNYDDGTSSRPYGHALVVWPVQVPTQGHQALVGEDQGEEVQDEDLRQARQLQPLDAHEKLLGRRSQVHRDP